MTFSQWEFFVSGIFHLGSFRKYFVKRIFTPIRQDGKDGLKYYTDPFYFFELWYQEMEKESVENMKKQRNKKKVCRMIRS